MRKNSYFEIIQKLASKHSNYDDSGDQDEFDGIPKEETEQDDWFAEYSQDKINNREGLDPEWREWEKEDRLKNDPIYVKIKKRQSDIDKKWDDAQRAHEESIKELKLREQAYLKQKEDLLRAQREAMPQSPMPMDHIQYPTDLDDFKF